MMVQADSSRIKALRSQLGLTQKQFTRRLGLATSTIQKWDGESALGARRRDCAPGPGGCQRGHLRHTTTSRRTRWKECSFHGLSAVLLLALPASQPETLRVAHVWPDESLHGGQYLLDVIAVVVNPLMQQFNDAQLADRRVIA